MRKVLCTASIDQDNKESQCPRLRHSGAGTKCELGLNAGSFSLQSLACSCALILLSSILPPLHFIVPFGREALRGQRFLFSMCLSSYNSGGHVADVQWLFEWMNEGGPAAQSHQSVDTSSQRMLRTMSELICFWVNSSCQTKRCDQIGKGAPFSRQLYPPIRNLSY